MNTRRWLLPFTYGVDMQAIDSVVGLAESGGTTLVALSLVSVPEAYRSRGARLEDIQQSKDFLEAVRWRAARDQVPVEYHEVFTGDVLGSIATLVHDLSCDSIVLVSSQKHEALLHTHELKHLLTEPPASFILLRLPTPPERPHLGTLFLSWLRRALGREDELRLVREEPETENPLRSDWMNSIEGDPVPGRERR
jgi:hypothetical protein